MKNNFSSSGHPFICTIMLPASNFQPQFLTVTAGVNLREPQAQVKALTEYFVTVLRLNMSECKSLNMLHIFFRVGLECRRLKSLPEQWLSCWEGRDMLVN
jgi:hypothetical protein